MAKLEGVDKLLTQLRGLAAKAKVDDKATATVGFTASYAIYVHEDLQANHPNGGQAKFLEQPARALRQELGKIIIDMMLKKKTLSQAVLVAALRLQRESQKLCPVDTGYLRASAFTRLDK
jgi:hypothetical protein